MTQTEVVECGAFVANHIEPGEGLGSLPASIITKGLKDNG